MSQPGSLLSHIYCAHAEARLEQIQVTNSVQFWVHNYCFVEAKKKASKEPENEVGIHQKE